VTHPAIVISINAATLLRDVLRHNVGADQARLATQRDLLIRVLGALDSVGVPYMLTGSTASSIQGEPRLDHAYLDDWAARLDVVELEGPARRPDPHQARIDIRPDSRGGRETDRALPLRVRTKGPQWAPR